MIVGGWNSLRGVGNLLKENGLNVVRDFVNLLEWMFVKSLELYKVDIMNGMWFDYSFEKLFDECGLDGNWIKYVYVFII